MPSVLLVCKLVFLCCCRILVINANKHSCLLCTHPQNQPASSKLPWTKCNVLQSCNCYVTSVVIDFLSVLFGNLNRGVLSVVVLSTSINEDSDSVVGRLKLVYFIYVCNFNVCVGNFSIYVCN